MSRVLRWLPWFTTLALVFVARVSAQEQLANPGFEGAFGAIPPNAACPTITGAIAPSWSENSCWEGNPVGSLTYARDTVNPHSGASSQRIGHTGGGIAQMVQDITLESGRRYTARVWLRADVPMNVMLALREAGPPYTLYVTKLVAVSSAWREYVLAGFTETTPGVFMVIGQSPGTLWVDDASLTSVPAGLTLATGVVPRSFFGMHFHGSDVPWPAPGFRLGSVRIWDSDGPAFAGPAAQWAGINPSPGVYVWSSLDAHVARAEANGADIVFNFARTPQWASARPNEFSPYGPGQAAEPATLQIWRDWVTAVATRYRGRIRYWEIWNEPNLTDFYSGTPEQLVELAREAYTILKQIDASNVVVTPGFVDLGYLDRYLELGGGAYADVIAYHFYYGGLPESVYQTTIPNALAIMATHGQQAKPLWDSESGWWLPPVFETELGEALIARTHLLFWAGGVSRHYHYAWDSPGPANIELALRPGFATATPAGLALAEVSRWMVGARMTSIASDASGTWVLGMTLPDGSTAHAVWNTAATSAAPRPFPVPLAWGATRMRTLRGVESALATGANVGIERRPVLISQLPVADAGSAAARPGLRLSAESPRQPGGLVRLRIELPTATHVTLRIHDLAGARVADLGSEPMSAGSHIRTWRPSRAAGMYFARLTTASGGSSSAKFTIR